MGAFPRERRGKPSGLTTFPRERPEHQVAEDRRMGRQGAVALYVLALVAVVVGVDILFFRNHVWERLIANVGIVMVFAAFGLRYLPRR